ncbi:MAG: LamG-like jellyroll fold domain-containing protein [Candidatus Paceibacterota bacterium]|jgi:prepilin-type N-terminal cleavage/methylation domain-containing protein
MPSKNNQQFKKEKAFTLIELLVVIAIIGILAGLITVGMAGSLERARIAKIQGFSSTLRTALMGNRISEWKFDEGTSTNAGDTVGANNGTISNPTWNSGADCVSGSCLQLAGGVSSVSFGNNSTLYPGYGNFTVEGWVFPRGYAYPRQRFPIGNAQAYRGVGYPGWLIDGMSYDSNGITVSFNDGVNYANSVISCDAGYRPPDLLNKWQHMVVVFDRSAGKSYSYINGVKQSGSINISAVVGDVRTTQAVTFGNESGWYLDGFVDEIRIYSAALTSSAIRGQYLAGLDKLLANNQITQQDYQQRLADLNSTYAVKE